MFIHRIYVSKSGAIKVYHGYLELLEKRLEYWSQLHPTTYQRFQNYLHLVRQQEKALELLYNMPRGSLKGAHFIYGSGREMREAIASAQTRAAIINGTIKFEIKLTAETRRVKVFTIDEDGDLSFFRIYTLRHNFFGGAIMEDPITSAG